MTQLKNKLHVNMYRQLRFETLLADISTRFINLPADRIDSAIEDAQRQICECLDLDLSSLWQWSTDAPSFLRLTHLYSPPNGPARPDRINGEETFPWVYRKILQGETVAFSTERLPPEAVQDRDAHRSFGIKSALAIPLAAGGKPVIGTLTFNSLWQERSWSEEIIKRLQLVAQIFTNALARKQAEEDLRKSEERLKLATDSAGVGIWELDVDTRLFWATALAREIFAYNREKELSLARFERSIHPDDLDRVRKAINNAIEKGDAVNVEYRILVGPDRLKWISSTGRPCFDNEGKPVRLLGASFDISARKRLEDELVKRLEEVEMLKRQLENENFYLREDLRSEQGFEKIIGKSKELKTVLLAARQVASTDATVLILGETGTGKGLFADAIHQMSLRKSHPFVTVNCAALPHNLIESELFGRERGAFTGSDARQAGRFEIADRGTIFLDEIGEIPLELQAKLLRVLQEGEFERLGSAKTLKVDARVIAATGRNLRDEVQRGRFREDLFYRLNVFPITIPPLRQRPEDIPLLAQHFIEKYAHKMGKRINSINRSVLNRMVLHSWPGNVRELEHLVERGVIISPGSSLDLDDLPAPFVPISGNEPGNDLASIERRHIRQVLRQTDWKIEGSGGAASILDLHPSTLRFRLKKLGIRRPF